MNLDELWDLADRARSRGRMSDEDARFVRTTLPDKLAAFPEIDLPKRIRHPAGFSVSGAPVGTFVRSAILLAGQRVLGRRFGGHEFYERVEKDVAFRIMRSHFHNGYPKGTDCCAQCTLAVYPVLEAGAIRYFDSRKLAESVREIIEQKQWRFSGATNAKMVRWALGQSEPEPAARSS